MRVPTAFRNKIERDDLRWSLNTYSLRIAAPLALRLAIEIKRVFQVASEQTLSSDEIIGMVRNQGGHIFFGQGFMVRRDSRKSPSNLTP
jgi:Domain of unknown function (DUF6538)